VVEGPLDLAAVAAAFGRRLHDEGVPVTPERSARFAQVVALLEPTRLEQLYWSARITLVSDHRQLGIFDRVFAEVFPGVVESGQLRPDDAAATPPRPPTVAPAPGSGDPDEAGERGPSAVSSSERLATRHFAACTPQELAWLSMLVEQLVTVPPPRSSRRTRKDHSGRQIDVRATLRKARSTGGDPVRVVRRRRVTRPRRVVLIADVSGSMEAYARIYLHLMRGAVRAVRAEAFVFATRLTRVTRALKYGNTDTAYAAAAAAAPDWSGGTRIGPALNEFLDRYGRRGLARGAVVVIVSDGWESGDVEELREAMRRLSRLAYAVIWVNPRSAGRDYQPLAGGMAAALDYVDSFVSGHSLRAIDDVLSAIRSAGASARADGQAGQVGGQRDRRDRRSRRPLSETDWAMPLPERRRSA
jgi:uncharacterized protein